MQFAPQYPRGHSWWFRGSQIQKSGEAVIRLDRLAPNLGHVCGFVWEWALSQYNSPLNIPGGISGGLWDSKFKSGKAAKQPDRLAPIWYTSVDSSGNGHTLNTSRPSITQGAFGGGGLGGQQFKILGNVVKWLDRFFFMATRTVFINTY